MANVVEILVRAKDEFSAVLSRADKSFKDLAIAGSAVSGAGLAISGTLLALTKAAANYGDSLNDLSKKTGASAAALAGCKLLADRSGSSIEGRAAGMAKLAKNAALAAGGNEQAGAVFKAMGISIADANEIGRQSCR